MIFVTVGNQMSFDRMLRVVDKWAGEKRREDIFAQIGPTKWRPKHIKWVHLLKPEEFREKVKEAELIIAHAGVGVFFTTREFNKPLLTMPRLAKFRETRSNHQLAMAKQFAKIEQVSAAFDEKELLDKLNNIETLQFAKQNKPPRTREEFSGFLGTIRSFINDTPEPCRLHKYFDSIICFGGEDWWYHNRGHHDMQIMSELSNSIPVLYINSIGMRIPSIKGSMFLQRILRKLKSFMQNLKHIRKNFWVFTAITSPTLHRFNILKKLLTWQVKLIAKNLGFNLPLIWVVCPTAAEVVRKFSNAALVYQRNDRYECYPTVDYNLASAHNKFLQSNADLTILTSKLLFEEEKNNTKHAIYVDHGVDYYYFVEARKRAKQPEDIKNIPYPRVGFIGNMDSPIFDPKLFIEIASGLVDYSFVMVGTPPPPNDRRDLPNVYSLGQKDYEKVADYMASCDVLIIPANINEWTQACNPIKLKEYLAVGRPIVSTPFNELTQYKGLVLIASNAQEFITAIRQALICPIDAARQRERVKKESWEIKAKSVLKKLNEINIYKIQKNNGIKEI